MEAIATSNKKLQYFFIALLSDILVLSQLAGGLLDGSCFPSL